MGVVSATRTAWHFFLCILLRTYGPRLLEVRDEVPLSNEPLRLDYLLLRRELPAGSSEAPEDEALTLRRLWPMLPRVSIMEYKSPAHPYRSGHLDRLWGYVHIYVSDQCAASGGRAAATAGPGEGRDTRQSLARLRADLAAVLIVARRTPSLDADVAVMGLSWEDCGAGYWRVRGGQFALFVVEIDVAGPAEGDDLLYSLGHGKPVTDAARRFWAELVGSKEAGMSMENMEGYEELMRKFLRSVPVEERLADLTPEQRLAGLPPEQRLAGLPPEQRLAGLPPEQRLAGLDRDHQALALPIEVVRALSEGYLRSLSPEVQAELRRRIEQKGS
jgi:hypothetical protein